MDYFKVSPASIRAVYALDQPVRASGLEPALLELVKLRVSLMNGCAYCVDVHTLVFAERQRSVLSRTRFENTCPP